MSIDSTEQTARRLRDALAEGYAPMINDPEAMALCRHFGGDGPENKGEKFMVPLGVVYSAMLNFARREREANP